MGSYFGAKISGRGQSAGEGKKKMKNSQGPFRKRGKGPPAI